jgi:hypothetical protein
LITDLKELTSNIRSEIKEMKGVIQAKNTLKKEGITTIKENIEKYKDEYDSYKDSVLYNIKNECAVKPEGNAEIKEMIKEHPIIREIDIKLQEYSNQIDFMSKNITIRTEAHKQKTKELRDMLKKWTYNDLERSVIRMTIKDKQNEYNKTMKIIKKEKAMDDTRIHKIIHELEKKRSTRFKKIRKTVRKKLKENKQLQKEELSEEKRIRKELRKQADYKEEINNKHINGLVDTYKSKMIKDLHELDDTMLEKERAKEAEKERKLKEREHKRMIRERERAHKAHQREAVRKTRKLEQDRKKKEKELSRKTRKTRT